MKALTKLFLSALFSIMCLVSLQSQSCGGVNCASDITSEIYTNMDCSGSWNPDIEACWGTQQILGGRIMCVLIIFNNSGSETLTVTANVPSPGTPVIQNVSPSSCTVMALGIGIDEIVYVNFSSSSNDFECDSEFYLNCV